MAGTAQNAHTAGERGERGCFGALPAHRSAPWPVACRVVGMESADVPVVAVHLRSIADTATLDTGDAWAALNHAHHRRSGRKAGSNGTLRVPATPELCGRHW